MIWVVLRPETNPSTVGEDMLLLLYSGVGRGGEVVMRAGRPLIHYHLTTSPPSRFLRRTDLNPFHYLIPDSGYLSRFSTSCGTWLALARTVVPAWSNT